VAVSEAVLWCCAFRPVGGVQHKRNAGDDGGRSHRPAEPTTQPLELIRVRPGRRTGGGERLRLGLHPGVQALHEIAIGHLGLVGSADQALDVHIADIVRLHGTPKRFGFNTTPRPGSASAPGTWPGTPSAPALVAIRLPFPKLPTATPGRERSCRPGTWL